MLTHFKMPEKGPLVIAYAGTNYHNIEPRKRLYNAVKYAIGALEAGANAICYDIYDGGSLVEDHFTWKAEYEGRLGLWKHTVMPLTRWQIVKTFCEQVGLKFIPAIYQHATVEIVKHLGSCLIKVNAPAARSFPYFKFDERVGFIITEDGYTLEKKSLNCQIVTQEFEALKLETEWGYECLNPSFLHSFPSEAARRGCKLIVLPFWLKAEDAGHGHMNQFSGNALEMCIKEIRKCS